MLSKLANVKLNKFKDEEEGFTLIELLVVILIIGILAAVALPTFLNQGKKGADAAAQSDLRAVATKVEACATEGNTYTACLTGTGLQTGSTQVSLPNSMVAGGIVDTSGSEAYSLKRPAPKGTGDWYITSTGGNVGAPTKTAPSGVSF